MRIKHSQLNFRIFIRLTVVMLLISMLMVSFCACSQTTSEPEETQSPTAVPTAVPTQTAAPTPTPTPVPTIVQTPVPTPRPTPNISFPPFETDSNGAYTFPQVMVDKRTAMTGEPVYFKILTSKNVTSVQTIIDGEPGRTYTDFENDGDYRIWRTKINFTVGGKRKVQFKCNMASGGTVLIPDSRIRIEITFDYTAESTSKTISKGTTVTFTLKTPDNIDTIYALVDGVNQETAYTDAESDEGGVKVWKIKITFFGLGDREVTFEAHDGSSLEETFPEPGIPIIVQDSI